jgi:hypothetical protein
MSFIRDNCIRAVGQAARRRRRPLLAWLFCLAMTIAALPALPAPCAVPASCAAAGDPPCCGCCAAPAAGAAMACAPAWQGPSLRGVTCEAAPPAATAASVSAPAPRGGSRSLADDDADAVIVAVAPAPAAPSIVARRAHTDPSNAPPDPCLSLHPGRAPPASTT